MNYVKIVSALRETARDNARLHLINDLKQRLLEEKNNLNDTLQHYQGKAEQAAHAIKVIDYKVSQLDEADPDYKAKQEAYAKEKEAQEVNQDSANKVVTEYQELIEKRTAEHNEAVAKIVSGETKVSMYTLAENTKRLIDSVIDETVKSHLTLLLAEDETAVN